MVNWKRWAWFGIRVVLVSLVILVISWIPGTTVRGVSLGLLAGVIIGRAPTSKALGVVMASYRMKRAEIAARREQ